jgi:hypothetical protein
MKLGVPAAFDKMGTYHQRGIGVKAMRAEPMRSGNWRRTWVAQQRRLIWAKLKGTYDNPSQGFWGNREVALKMLECSFAQGNGDGAYELA